MHPTLLTIAGFDLPSYGVLVALGILAGTSLSVVLGRRCGVGSEFVIDVVFWMVLGGFVGARVGYMTVEWHDTLRDPVGTLLSGGGGIFLAGALAGGLAVLGVCRRHHVSFARCADMLAPGAALAHAFGRVGCFLSGCCYGRPASGLFEWAGVRFPKQCESDGAVTGSWAYLDHLRSGMVDPTATYSLPVYPVQLVEAVFNLLVCALLLVLWKRRTGNGQLFLVYVSCYCAGRFVLEFLRGDGDRGVWGGLSLSQWLCGAMLLAALWILRRTRRRVQTPLQASLRL